jgi:hypothetical protein
MQFTLPRYLYNCSVCRPPRTYPPTQHAHSAFLFGSVFTANMNGAVDRYGTQLGDGQWQCYFKMNSEVPKSYLRGPQSPTASARAGAISNDREL